LPTFAPTKVGRRKGETSQLRRCIKRICPSPLEPHSGAHLRSANCVVSDTYSQTPIHWRE
ncbi:hypothetical protein, partial [Pseudomonas sp.]